MFDWVLSTPLTQKQNKKNRKSKTKKIKETTFAMRDFRIYLLCHINSWLTVDEVIRKYMKLLLKRCYLSKIYLGAYGYETFSL